MTKRLARPTAALLAAVIPLLLMSCEGTLAGSESNGGPGASESSTPTTNADLEPGTPAALVHLQEASPVSARMRRLTRSEFTHSLQDLLGENIETLEVEADSRVDGFGSIGASSVATSPAGVVQYEAAVRAALEQLFQDDEALASRLACVPEDETALDCLAEAISGFGRRAFRRPLDGSETQRYADLAVATADSNGNDILVGLESALSAILQSPNFLYRVELGVPSAQDSDRLKYTDFELASRLAATLWDSVPDDELLDAAASGSLATPEGLLAQATRLLDHPKARRAVTAFANELFGLSHLEEASKDPEMFPTWTPSLKEAMHEEFERRIEDIVFDEPRDFLSLFDERVTFVNPELARHYGLEEPTENVFERREIPADSPRAGILGSGAILAGHALPQRTSPTARGKFITEAVLCVYVPPPPPNIPPLPPMVGPDATLREQLSAHIENPSCAGCHAVMDPVGFGMENFDSVGNYRTTDNGHPVDATGALDGSDTLNGATFDGLAELGTAIREQPAAGPCLVTKVYSETLGRSAQELDAANINLLSDRFEESEHHLKALLLELVQSDAFRFVAPGEN